MHSLYTFSWLALVTVAACGQADEPADSGEPGTISSALLKTTYSYRRVISAGDPLPGGASCGMYFSLDGINSRGDLAFGIEHLMMRETGNIEVTLVKGELVGG